MASKPSTLDLTGMKSTSESSTPTEEYHTPPAEGFILDPHEAFPFTAIPAQPRFQADDFRKMNAETTTTNEGDADVSTKLTKQSEGSSTRRTFRIPSRNPQQAAEKTTLSSTLTKTELDSRNLINPHEQVSDSDLVSIRKRLEERRKRIETEKKRQEQEASQQRNAVNKQVFHSLLRPSKQDSNNKNFRNSVIPHFPSSDNNSNNNGDTTLQQNESNNNIIDLNNNPLNNNYNNNQFNTISKSNNTRSLQTSRDVAKMSKSYYGQESSDVLGKLFASDNRNFREDRNHRNDSDNIISTRNHSNYDTNNEDNHVYNEASNRNYAKSPVKQQLHQQQHFETPRQHEHQQFETPRQHQQQQFETPRQQQQQQQQHKQQLVRPSLRLAQPNNHNYSPSHRTLPQHSPTKTTSKLQSPTKQQSLLRQKPSPTKPFPPKPFPFKAPLTTKTSPTKQVVPRQQQHQQQPQQPQQQQPPPGSKLSSRNKPAATLKQQLHSRQQQYPQQQQQQQLLQQQPQHHQQHSTGERRKWIKPTTIKISKSARPSKPNAKSSDKNTYGTSLERLNSSLTELQSEIMQLSLQHALEQSPTSSNAPREVRANLPSNQAGCQGDEEEEEGEEEEDVQDDNGAFEGVEDGGVDGDGDGVANEGVFEDQIGYNDGADDDNVGGDNDNGADDDGVQGDDGDDDNNDEEVLQERAEVHSSDGYLSSASHAASNNKQGNHCVDGEDEGSAFQRYSSQGRAQRIQQQKQLPSHRSGSNQHYNNDTYPTRSFTNDSVFNDRYMTPPQVPLYADPMAYHTLPRNDIPHYPPPSMAPPHHPYPYYPLYTPPGYYPHYPFPPYNHLYSHPSQPPPPPPPPLHHHQQQQPQQPSVQSAYHSQFRSLDRRREGHKIKRDTSLGGFPRSPTRQPQYLPDGSRSRRESSSAHRTTTTASHIPARKSFQRPSSVISDYFHSTEADFTHAFRQHQTSSSYPPLSFSSEFNSPLHHHQHHRRPSLLSHSRHSFSSPGYLSPQQQQQIYHNLEATNNLASSFYETEYNSTSNSPQQLQLQQQQQQHAAKQPRPQPESFTIDLDGPKRPKPQIGSYRKNAAATTTTTRSSRMSNSQSSDGRSENKSLNNNNNNNENINDNNNNNQKTKKSEDKTLKSELKSNASSSPSFLKTDEDASETGSVGFIIDDATTNDPILQAEVEKKRLKLQELHEKRKKQVESKKKVRTDQQEERMQEMLVKEEEMKQKKEEEKQRRQAIFKQYLQRKAAEQSDASLPEDAVQATPTKALKSTNKPQATVRSAVANGRTKGPNKQSSIRPRSQLILPSTTANGAGGADVGKPLTADIATALDSYDKKGPKLFVKPNQKSNRSIVINAVKDCCLAGSVNKELMARVLDEITKSDSNHFVVLFRDAGLQFRGVYSYSPERNEVIKIYGVGPRQLLDTTMEKFYKYNSGCKNFSEVTSTKHLSSTIDGVTIPATMWVKKATPPTATVTPYNNNGGGAAVGGGSKR